MKIPTDDAISHPTSSSTKTLPAEEVGENKELDDGLWEDDDDEEENPVLNSACKTEISTTMDVEVDNGVECPTNL